MKHWLAPTWRKIWISLIPAYPAILMLIVMVTGFFDFLETMPFTENYIVMPFALFSLIFYALLVTPFWPLLETFNLLDKPKGWCLFCVDTPKPAAFIAILLIYCALVYLLVSIISTDNKPKNQRKRKN